MRQADKQARERYLERLRLIREGAAANPFESREEQVTKNKKIGKRYPVFRIILFRTLRHLRIGRFSASFGTESCGRPCVSHIGKVAARTCEIRMVRFTYSVMVMGSR